MFEIIKQSKPKPYPKLSDDQKQSLAYLKNFCKITGTDKNELANCIGLKNWHSFISLPNRGMRIEALAKVIQAIRRANIKDALTNYSKAA